MKTAALDIIVNQQRLRDGSRRIMSISEWARVIPR